MHVHADENDVLISHGTGMTGAINKFIRILGLRVPENMSELIKIPDEMRPVILVSHYEHHSNQTSWEHTIAIVEIVPSDSEGMVSVENFRAVLLKHKDRKLKYASISACSNVSGIKTPYHDIAKLMHQHDGMCFVDFAASFGYVDIDMHPKDRTNENLDAIFLSPHKLLGGPGSPGIVIFNMKLYNLNKPESVGGGVVNWTNPWREHSFLSNIEQREDCGTPGFLQLIRAALAVKLKEKMTTKKISLREHEINELVFAKFDAIVNLKIIAGNCRDRLSIFSVNIEGLHYNLFTKLLNDRFGIQARGGCHCAGTYVHIIFNIPRETSKQITDLIDIGDNSNRPGWTRISFHPTMTDKQVTFVCDSVKEIATKYMEWGKDYAYNSSTNQFTLITDSSNWESELAHTFFK